MSKLIIIISLIIILFFTLLYNENYEITYENFDQNVPTPIALPVRSDMTCSGSGESIIFDRYNKNAMNSLASGISIPPSLRNNNLSINNATPQDTAGTQGASLSLNEYSQKCNGDTDQTKDTYGTKIFVDTGNPSLKPNGNNWYDNGSPYNLVNMYCCKGEMYNVPGTNQSNCLAPCPSNYTKDPSDNTICIRNDSNCVYTADLSANISQNWLNTCAMIYKQNVDITSTIQSISSVVSTFSGQTNIVTNNYTSLSNKLYNTTITNIDYLSNRNSNFHNINDTYNTVKGIQDTIIGTYTDLKAKKTTFDTLYSQFGCSNYMF
jgi:hypothetical protein